MLHTSSASGAVLSSPNTIQVQSSHKGKNGSKGKGKGKQPHQAQGEHKPVTLGNKIQRESHKSSTVNAGVDPVKSHHDLGLVRSKHYGGVEPHFSVNPQEQEAGVPAHGRPGVAGMGKPLVAIPNGHSIKGGRKNLGVESVVSKFAGANFAKIIPAGESKMDENGRLSGLGNKFDGVFGSHNSCSAVRGEHPIQSTHNVQGSTDGNFGACSMLVEVRRDGQEHSEEPELEFAEPNKEPTSSF